VGFVGKAADATPAKLKYQLGFYFDRQVGIGLLQSIAKTHYPFGE
jgi:hypothetical protein